MLLAEFGMLFFFTNLSLMEFQVRYLALFLLFSVIGDFGSSWIGNLHKNIQLMPEFLKGPFLVLHFLLYINDLLMMVSVVLLPILMILPSTLNVVRNLICVNNWNCLLNLSLIFETLDWGRKWLVDFNAEKLIYFCFTGLITLVLLM